MGARDQTRTSVGPRAGVMPPWYVEKNIGIQKFKNDPSLSEKEIAMIAQWADSGAPRGNPADMPAPRQWDDGTKLAASATPDLVVKTTDVVVNANAPDWWGEIPRVPTGLDEDRYVSAVEVKEVNDIKPEGSGRATVGGHYVFHHMIWSTSQSLDGDIDPTRGRRRHDRLAGPRSGPQSRLLRSEIGAPAESRLEHRLRLGAPALERTRHEGAPRDRIQVHAEGLSARVPTRAELALGNGVDIDIAPMEASQQLHAYAVLERAHQDPVVRAAPPRARDAHVPGSDLGLQHPDAELRRATTTTGCAAITTTTTTRRCCRRAPSCTSSATWTTRPSNKNVPDPRNWQGSGNRSVTNMFIDLGNRVRSPTSSSSARWRSAARS